jgi:glyoxylase-like metal-dependent hydrolase (beta-lactamase superfamily II)
VALVPTEAGAVTVATITALDCGWLRTQERTLIGGGSTEAIEIPVPAWLVRHGDDVVVFDAGLHPALAGSSEPLGRMSKLFQPMLEEDGSIGCRLTQHDVDPHGAFTVVVSHTHFDHVGGLCEMPNARVVVNRDEWAIAMAAGQEGGFDTALVDLGHDVLTITGEHDLFGDGAITCIPTPGHTCGHQSLRVITSGGPVILTSDACYFTRTLDDEVLPPFAFDHDLQRRSLALLRREREKGTRIVPGHDAEAFRAITAQPL